MKKPATLAFAPKADVRRKRPARARRTPVGVRKPKSLVDEMLGIAELRAPSPGSDPLYDTLHARLVTRR